MPNQRPLPETPRPGNGGNARITDFFKSIERTENDKRCKREFEDEEDEQMTKRFKRSDDGYAGSIKTARYQIKLDTPRTRQPVSARLLEDTDGGLREALVGRRDFLEEETPEDEMGPRNTDIERDAMKVDTDDTAMRRRSKVLSPQFSTRRPKKKKKSSSARLLDDTDGGLNDALAGQFENTRFEESVPDEVEYLNDSPKHHNLSDEPTATEKNDMDAKPRDRFRTPSPQRLPTTPKHHSNHCQEEHDTS